MNLVVLKGRLTKDPECRETQTGKSVASFTVACDNGKDRDGNKYPADFIDCTAWEGLADMVAKWFSKGREIVVSGAIKTQKYEKNGQNRYRTYVLARTVEFCGSANRRTDDTEKYEPDDFQPLDDAELPF